MVRTSKKWGKFGILSQILPWRSMSSPSPPPPPPPHNTHTPTTPTKKKIGILNNVFCSSDPGLNGWWVIVRTSKWLIHTHGQTHRCRWWQYPKAKIEHHPSTKELCIENVYYKTNQDLCTILGLGTKAAAVCQVQYKPKKICGWAASVTDRSEPLIATCRLRPVMAARGRVRYFSHLGLYSAPYHKQWWIRVPAY